jgi:hypothetical protein
MSRSFVRTPITGMTTAVSEKQDKRLANRRLRRSARQRLHEVESGAEADAVMVPLLRDVSNVYSFDKDGKQWLDNPEPSDWRK